MIPTYSIRQPEKAQHHKNCVSFKLIVLASFGKSRCLAIMRCLSHNHVPHLTAYFEIDDTQSCLTHYARCKSPDKQREMSNPPIAQICCYAG